MKKWIVVICLAFLLVSSTAFALDGEIWTGIYPDSTYKVFPAPNEPNRQWGYGWRLEHKFKDLNLTPYTRGILFGAEGENIGGMEMLVGVKYDFSKSFFIDVARMQWWEGEFSKSVHYNLIRVGYKFSIWNER